jgi:hypothetical protein
MYLCPMHEESPDINSIVYSKEMVALVSAANNTCLLLEELKETAPRAFIESAVKHLAAVYHGILGIGQTEPVFESPLEHTVTEQDWSGIYQRVAALLGPYNDILRPAGEEEFDTSELVRHTISEDLADLYQELRDFTITYSRGLEELMNDAAWELRERFAEHWGEKLLRALTALHRLYVEGIDPEEVNT